MDNPQIGIKIADGSFYPVLQEGSKAKMRLVLTTVKDDQKNVQIDLYRSSEQTIDNADYIGSLLIENISPSPKGDPEIEVILGIDDDGNLDAIATDIASGNKQELQTSLTDLQTQEEPAFDLEPEAPSETPWQEEEEELTGDAYPIEAEDRRKTHLEKKKGPMSRILFIVIGLIVIAGITILLFWLFSRSPQTKPTEAGQIEASAQREEGAPPDATETTNEGKSEQTSGKQESATQTGAAAEAETASEQSTSPEDSGVWYVIKWGDTLWDISTAYYRNPWMYPKIANHSRNGIKNPDYILAGFRLFIPEN